MKYDQFLYYVRFNAASRSLNVEIGYYDPERFDGEGGHVFALTTSVLVDDNNFGADEPNYKVKVEQSGNSYVDLETAEMRAEVGRQALEMGRFIQDQLDAGESLDSIAAFLKSALHDREPVSKGFRYMSISRIRGLGDGVTS